MADMARRSGAVASSIALVFSLAFPGSQANSQQLPVNSLPDSSAKPADGEIVVTGSRLGKSAFNSPTPVIAFGAERMQQLAIPNVGDALNQIPSFRAISSPSSNLFRVSGNIGARNLDLRGLSTSRTLVLVDGKRFVPSGDNGAVDINAVPSALVKRAEVVTGGASAIYGADAVAGVVNLILDTKFTGIKMDVSGGISGHGDAKNVFASVAVGHDFAGGRGHYVIGAEYQNERGVGACQTRAYCGDFGNYLVNPGYNASTGKSTNGLPANIVVNNVLYAENRVGVIAGAVRTVGGVNTTLGQQVLNSGANLLPAALQGKQFNAAGTGLAPFQFGQLLSGVFMVGGDPSVDALFGFGDQPLVVPTRHFSALAHVNYELTDNIRMSADALFSRVIGGPTRASVLTQAPINLKITGGPNGLGNPFITPEVRATILAADANIASINVNVAKTETDMLAVGTSRNDTWRAALGLAGDLGRNWKWDASYTYGRTEGRLVSHNNRLRDFDNVAADAVTPPAGYAGTIYTTPTGAPVICASSITAPTNGCLPVNYLGLNSLTPAVRAKYLQDSTQTRHIYQHAVAANLRGPLFNMWAGPVRAAVGFEWRRDSAQGNVDALTAANAFASASATLLPEVKRDVTEVNAEASVPLLADLPFAKALTLDGAVRRTHYSSSGNATTWKAGLVYEPNNQILFRVTKSNDIRAPTAAELNPNTTTVRGTQGDPFAGGTHLVNSVSGGSPNLKLERADTMTAGVVLKPSFLRGFRLSVDYYNIKVKDAIDTVSTANILTSCAQQNLLCNLIVFSGAYKASPVETVFNTYQNLSRLRAEGAELVANYSFDAVGGNIDVALNANYIVQLRTIGATGAVSQLDGVTGNFGNITNTVGVPRYKIDTVVTYARNNWSVTAQGRYVPRGILDPTKVGPEDLGYSIDAPNSISTNRVDPRFYLNLSGTWSPGWQVMGAKVQFYGSVMNVFDTEEPVQLRIFGNPLQFDPIGRAFRIGVRANW